MFSKGGSYTTKSGVTNFYFNSNCKVCDTVLNREWRRKNPTKMYLKSRRHIEKYPYKQEARLLVKYAVKQGMLTRKPCEECGQKNTHAHHNDYSKPLEVVWLCPKHHSAVHYA